MQPPKWISEVVATVRGKIASADDQARIGLLDSLKRQLHALSPLSAMPIDCVTWIPVSDVQANDYNPNAVAPHEMRLLHTSIDHDGYTQPIVASWDEELGKYVIVDGFHRHTVCRTYPDIQERTFGRVPVVVIEKSLKDRMASTVRHNRARGKHSVEGMASLVFGMLEEHADDKDICNELGLEPEELIRLKHVTGFAKLFENSDYRKSWMTARQAKLRRDYEAGRCVDMPDVVIEPNEETLEATETGVVAGEGEEV